MKLYLKYRKPVNWAQVQTGPRYNLGPCTNWAHVRYTNWAHVRLGPCTTGPMYNWVHVQLGPYVRYRDKLGQEQCRVEIRVGFIVEEGIR